MSNLPRLPRLRHLIWPGLMVGLRVNRALRKQLPRGQTLNTIHHMPMYGIKLVHILTTFTPVNWLLICYICSLYSYSRGSGADMVDNSDCMPRSVIVVLEPSV